MDREIVLVTGAPASGKSTLAGPLAEALGMNLIGKDLVKETLWDVLAPPDGDLGWSKRLGAAAMEVIWTLAAQSRRVVLEANFRPHSEHEMARLSDLSANMVEVHCCCPPDVARQRYERRAAQRSHHRAHVTPTLDTALLAEFDRPLGLGAVITVDTTHAVDVEGLSTEILSELAREGP
jgi:predicted kinase